MSRCIERLVIFTDSHFSIKINTGENLVIVRGELIEGSDSHREIRFRTDRNARVNAHPIRYIINSIFRSAYRVGLPRFITGRCASRKTAHKTIDELIFSSWTGIRERAMELERKGTRESTSNWFVSFLCVAHTGCDLLSQNAHYLFALKSKFPIPRSTSPGLALDEMKNITVITYTL